jgi:uncharacterized protein
MFSRMADVSICPTCKGRASAYPENPVHPFCSRRCKLADLSNWFNEQYGVPAESFGEGEHHGEPEGEEEERKLLN